MTINGRDIVLFLLGSQWESTGMIFSALGPAIGMTVIYGTISWLHLSLGYPERWLKWGIVALVFTILALLAGLQFGALGVALADSLSFYFLTWPGIWYASKPIGMRMSYILSAIWRFFSAAIFSGVVTWWVTTKVHFITSFTDNIHLLIKIGFSSGLCFLLYFLVLIILYGSVKPLINTAIELKSLLPGYKID